MTEQTKANNYPARLQIDYPAKLNRLTTLLRLIWVIPIGIILQLVHGMSFYYTESPEHFEIASLTAGISVAAAFMIVFRRRYPRWWFDFLYELTRFQARVVSYLFLLTDAYPSTEEEQSVHLEIDYPDVERDLNRWLPLVKWLLAIPHYIVLMLLSFVALASVVTAWFAILFTGTYPRPLFDLVVGVGRWGLRVFVYAFLLVTDEYPPFSLR